MVTVAGRAVLQIDPARLLGLKNPVARHLLRFFSYDTGPWIFSDRIVSPDGRVLGGVLPTMREGIADMTVDDLPAYRAEEQPWWPTLPQLRSVTSRELTAYAETIDVVLITATEPELQAVLGKLDPYPGHPAILKGVVGPETYYLGQFGGCLAAVTKCRMGSLDAGGAALATSHAQHVWYPRAIIMVGIALGGFPAKQKMADVLIASQIISYEPERRGETQNISRGPIPPASTTLLNRFENALDWSFSRPDGSKSERHVGPLLSGEKLVDDPTFKAKLFRRFPQAIGGEMEGVGVAATAVREGIPWLLVKAICDWADGKKHKQHQPLAAAAAVSLVHHVLSETDVLHGLAKKQLLDYPTLAEVRLRPAAVQGDAPRHEMPTPRKLFDQSRLVQQKTEHFVGREFAFEFIDRFCRSNACGYLVVEGIPGIGKSSLLAEFVRRRRGPAHFNNRAEGIDGAVHFNENMHAQFAERLQLPGSVPPSAGRDSSYIEYLLSETSTRLTESERLVIVVDALDEVAPSAALGANPLFLPTTLPGGVFFLVSRRAHTATLQVESPLEVLDLMDYPEHNRRNAEQFIRAVLMGPVRERLGTAAEFTALVTSLLDRSESNFMYLHYVLKDIEHGRISDGALRNLPIGLRGYYERHWERMTAVATRNKECFQTIYALAELSHPVTASLLADCIGIDPVAVHQILDAWAQFLEIGASVDPLGGKFVRVFSLYHKSFADFLMEKGTVQAAGIDLGDIRRRIGDGLLHGFHLDQ